MLIHKMRLDEYMAVLDVNSGAVHLVDDVIYDLLDVFDGTNDDEAIAALQTSYPEKDLREALEELHQLQEEGLLFSPEFEVPQTFAETPILKSLCLHIAHDCNLRCGYCFAGTGDFGGYRAMMSKETAEKAVEFAIAGSKMRHNLELDLFGGEPLMNPEVVKHVINYVRRREFETGKNNAAGGPILKISAPIPFMGSFAQNTQNILLAAQKMPLGVPAPTEISSRFGGRANPFTGGGGELHLGIDFRGENGDPIKATATGVVNFAGTQNGYGNIVRITHDNGYETMFAHMSSIDVQVGQTVKAGDVVGKVGSTGRSTGPHLHYEIRKDGAPIDPERFLTLSSR